MFLFDEMVTIFSNRNWECASVEYGIIANGNGQDWQTSLVMGLCKVERCNAKKCKITDCAPEDGASLRTREVVRRWASEVWSAAARQNWWVQLCIRHVARRCAPELLSAMSTRVAELINRIQIWGYLIVI